MLYLLVVALIALLFIGLIYWVVSQIFPPPIPAIVAGILVLILLLWIVSGIDWHDTSNAAIARL